MLDLYFKGTKRTNDGHCGMEAETFLQFIQHVAASFPVEINEETTWTEDKMESVFFLRTNTLPEMIAVKEFTLLGLQDRNFEVFVLKGHVNGQVMTMADILDIIESIPPKRITWKDKLLGLIKGQSHTAIAQTEVYPDELDEELWEEEEE